MRFIMGRFLRVGELIKDVYNSLFLGFLGDFFCDFLGKSLFLGRKPIVDIKDPRKNGKKGGIFCDFLRFF